MTRSWLIFGLGVLLLVSPLRALWTRPGAPALGVFVLWAGLVALGWAVTRRQR